MLVYSDSACFIVLGGFAKSFAARGRIPPFLSIYSNEVEKAIQGLYDPADVV